MEGCKPRAWGCSRLVARPQPPQCTQPPGLQLWGWHAETRQWKVKNQNKTKRDLNKFPLALTKENNYIMLDLGWCLFFFVSPKGNCTPWCSCLSWSQALSIACPLSRFPLEAVLWHSCWCWSMSPLTPASLAALFQWLMQLPWKLQQSPKLSHSGMEIVFGVQLSLLSCLLSFFLWS